MIDVYSYDGSIRYLFYFWADAKILLSCAISYAVYVGLYTDPRKYQKLASTE